MTKKLNIPIQRQKLNGFYEIPHSIAQISLPFQHYLLMLRFFWYYANTHIFHYKHKKIQTLTISAAQTTKKLLKFKKNLRFLKCWWGGENISDLYKKAKLFIDMYSKKKAKYIVIFFLQSKLQEKVVFLCETSVSYWRCY